jgi:hypothetical protein
MNPTVTIHSDADGVTRTITLTKTGADTGHITIASTAAPGNDQDYDITSIEADTATLKLTCQTQVLFLTAEIDLSIQKGAGGKPPVATVGNIARLAAGKTRPNSRVPPSSHTLFYKKLKRNRNARVLFLGRFLPCRLP